MSWNDERIATLTKMWESGATTKLVTAAAWSNFSAHMLVISPISASMVEPMSPNQTIAQGC